MPLRQRIAHMPPERRRRIRDLGGEFLVGAGDILPKVKRGDIRAPASLRLDGRCWRASQPDPFRTSASISAA
jgi:hypothetical protein